MSRPHQLGRLTPVTAKIPAVINQTGLSRSEIYRLLTSGKLSAVKSGRSTLIVMDSVVQYLASLPLATFRARVAG